MQKVYLFITVVVSMVLNGMAQGQAEKYAVVVGCADYRINRLDLRYSDDDAYRFYTYLRSAEGGNVPESHVAILVDEAATKRNILSTMDDIFAKASSEDMLIFYYSGHGDKGAFCPTDIDPEKPSTFLYHSEVKAVFKKHPAKYKICFADACYSGSINGGSAPVQTASVAGASDVSIVIIMSSLPTEVSQENPSIREGAFTYYLRKGLSGSADRNNDRVITLEELFPYVKANVLNFTKNAQTPTIEGSAQRDMPIGYLR